MEYPETDLNRVSTSLTNVYSATKDSTRLQRAIKNGDQPEFEKILQIYQSDLNKVKEYIVQKYNWDVSDEIWIRKIVLIAANDQQCQEAKRLEDCSTTLDQNLDNAIFILLLIPQHNRNAAVIHPSDTNRISLFTFIKTLITNGVLSLNCANSDSKGESFIETAASSGNKAAITGLIAVGAVLDLPEHNPLLAACTNLQKEMIIWLLTEHFDRFDCTARNSYQFNAFMILMQKNAIDMMDFVLKKMISYRQKKYDETASEAFNQIFRCEHKLYTRSSILSILSTASVREKIEEYVVKYQLDLAYQWKGITMLTEMLYKRLAMEYCWAAIRNEPTLLGLVVKQDVTVVHECIRLGILDILNEIYELKPAVKRYFENNQAFESLQQALWHGERDSSEFILKHHNQFYLDNFDRLEKDVIFCSFHRKSFFERNSHQLLKYFPMLKVKIEAKVTENSKLYPDLMDAFRKVELVLGESFIENKDFDQKSLPNIRGPNGTTLLHYAVETSNVQLLDNLLCAGCDLNALDNEGNHPIHYIRNIDMFHFLVERQRDGQLLVHRTNFTGCTVLHKICQLRSNYDEVISLLEAAIACGANINQVTNKGESAVFMITNVKVLEVLVKHNIQLDIVNASGETALQHHFAYRNRYLCSALLELTHQLPSFKEHAHKFIGPMIFNNRVYFTQVYKPFLQANPKTMKILFDSLVENSPGRASRMFCLACCNGQIFVIEKFLDFNYDLDYNYRGDDGQTPIVGLLNCIVGENVALVESLLEKGVDLEIRSNTGRNALLTYASRYTSVEKDDYSLAVVQRLLDYGANINARDNDGNTALHIAFGRNELELVDVLLRNGANPTMKNSDNKIPTQMGPSMLCDIFSFLN